MKKVFQLKSDCNLEDFQLLSPLIVKIFSSYLTYALIHNLPVTVTSVIHDRSMVQTKSSTHKTGRAMDVSIVKWSKKHIAGVVKYLNKKHYTDAAISASDFIPRAAVYGDISHKDHIHLQCKYLTATEIKKLKSEIQALIK